MAKGLGSTFSKTTAILGTGLASFAMLFNSGCGKADAQQTADAEFSNGKPDVHNVVRHTAADTIPAVSRRTAYNASTGKIVIHFNEDYVLDAMVFHNSLEKRGYPAEIFSGRSDANKPYEVFVDGFVLDQFTVEDADYDLTGAAANIYDHKKKNGRLRTASNSAEHNPRI